MLSFSLVIFAEVFCSVGFIMGALFRLCLIPMIVTMCVAFFVIHANDAFAAKELAFIYLVIFIIMFFTGAGKYSVDALIRKAME
jgi:putative oxidoreductase